MWNHKLYIYLWLWEATNWQSISVLICYKQFVCQSHFMTCLHLSFTLHDLCLFVLYTLWLAFACPFFHSITYLCLILSTSSPLLNFTCLLTHHDLPLPVLFHSMIYLCVTICFMFISGFHSFVLIKVISFVGDGFSYFLLFEHSLRVAGHSC